MLTNLFETKLSSATTILLLKQNLGPIHLRRRSLSGIDRPDIRRRERGRDDEGERRRKGSFTLSILHVHDARTVSIEGGTS